MLIANISEQASITFRSLEGLTTLLFAQREGLSKLYSNYANLFEAIGPLHLNEIIDENSNVLSTDRKFAINVENILQVMEDLGSYAMEAIAELGVEATHIFCQDVSKCVVNLIARIADVVAERDSSNESAADEIPPVLPHLLVKLRGRDFSQVLRIQRNRLLKTWSQVEINDIELEFQGLKMAYQNEEALKNVLNGCDHTTGFSEGWNYVQNRFNSLRLFCGAFPGTSNVESDFSILKWEKEDHRVGLTDFSLEGIFQAKQYVAIKKLAMEVL